VGFKIEGDGFILSLINFLQRLGEIHWLTLSIGLAGLALLIWLPRRFPRLPAALVTVVVFTALAGLLGLDRYGVAILGPVPAGIPELAWPQSNLAETKSLLRDALGIATVSFCSAMLTARSFAARHGYAINANHEFVALGVATWRPVFPRALPSAAPTRAPRSTTWSVARASWWASSPRW
jgi:MFS superfamily sulfate permease-like transporter